MKYSQLVQSVIFLCVSCNIKHYIKQVKCCICSGRCQKCYIKQSSNVRQHSVKRSVTCFQYGCAEADENVGYRFSINRTEPNQKLTFHSSKNRLTVWGRFSMLSHNSFTVQSSNVLGSNVKLLFFIPYLCNSSSHLVPSHNLLDQFSMEVGHFIPQRQNKPIQ